MGVFDDSISKLRGRAARHVKPERLAGPYELHEGYDDGLGPLRGLTRSARRRVEAMLDREALAMGAIGLAVGVAIGVAIMRRGRR